MVNQAPLMPLHPMAQMTRSHPRMTVLLRHKLIRRLLTDLFHTQRRDLMLLPTAQLTLPQRTMRQLIPSSRITRRQKLKLRHLQNIRERLTLLRLTVHLRTAIRATVRRAHHHLIQPHRTQLLTPRLRPLAKRTILRMAQLARRCRPMPVRRRRHQRRTVA